MTVNDQAEVSQQQVASWFDQTYRTRGFDYLRPLTAYPIFLQLLGARPGERLLDVACGPGLLLKAAQMKGLEPSGVDISAAAVEIAREFVAGADVREGNAEELPFEDGSFRLVTCIGAIERFLDRQAALLEMRRVAAPDARFCFMVRNASTPVWRVWRQLLGQRNVAGHQDALTLERWRELFAELGFAVEAVHIDQWFRQKLRRLYRGRPDFDRPEPVARPILPLRHANEFIFILKNAAAPAEPVERVEQG